MRCYVPMSGSPSDIVAMARHADECGYGGVTIPEHVFIPLEIRSRYPHSPDDKFPFPPDHPWADVSTMLGAMAAVTRHVHLRTGVHLALLRHPISVARAAATTALLSGDRLELGIGVGWLAQEYEVFGVDFARRGAMLDELVVVLRALWRHGPVEYHGTFWDLEPMHLEPAPDRPIPILIGGRSDAAHRRAARLGDGYLMSGAGLEEALETADRVNALRAEYGRADEPFAMHATAPDARTLDDFARLHRHGMASVTVSPWAPGSDLAARLRGMDVFASETLAAWPE